MKSTLELKMRPLHICRGDHLQETKTHASDGLHIHCLWFSDWHWKWAMPWNGDHSPSLWSSHCIPGYLLKCEFVGSAWLIYKCLWPFYNSRNRATAQEDEWWINRRRRNCSDIETKDGGICNLAGTYQTHSGKSRKPNISACCTEVENKPCHVMVAALPSMTFSVLWQRKDQEENFCWDRNLCNSIGVLPCGDTHLSNLCKRQGRPGLSTSCLPMNMFNKCF